MSELCHACGSAEVIAQVSDWKMDHGYYLCNKCLYGEWPPWEERKKRILAELETNTNPNDPKNVTYTKLIDGLGAGGSIY